MADALISISFYQRSILVRLCLCVNGDDKKMHAWHEAHVHVHTHATHGHAHVYAFESSDTSDSGTSNLFDAELYHKYQLLLVSHLLPLFSYVFYLAFQFIFFPLYNFAFQIKISLSPGVCL